MRFIPAALLFLGIIMISAPALEAQQNADRFRYGNDLMRQGAFEEAFEVFHELLEENPRSQPVFENAIEALIHMREYERAIQLARERLDLTGPDTSTRIRLGELYHYNSDVEQAREVWMEVVHEHPDQTQIYRRVGRAMRDRRDYEGAIEIYELARENLGNQMIFINELAQSYMAAGYYEDAMARFLELIAQHRHYIRSVQRQIMRYDERDLYDIAILETEDAVAEYQTDREIANQYRELLIWLYSERELYDRALMTAKAIEENPDDYNKNAVFDLARTLRSEYEFELAEEAYNYYIDQQDHNLRARSLEESAQNYQHWARHLQLNHQAYANKIRPLYEQAGETLRQLIEEYPDYERFGQVLVLKSELALDFLNDAEQARHHADRLDAITPAELSEAYHYYIDGRIKLFEGEFARARVALTRSNRIFRIGEMAEKTSYYLGLTDFYNGDYEYARMQFNQLERQHTSYYANDALQVRLWIQEGSHQGDRLPVLDDFSRTRFYMHNGEEAQAAEHIRNILNEHSGSPLSTETLLAGVALLAQSSPVASFAFLNHYTENEQSRIGGEEILWERARLAHYLFNNDYHDEASVNTAEILNSYFPDIADAAESQIPQRMSDITDLYEEVLIQHPQGYYASQIRQILRELEEEQQTL